MEKIEWSKNAILVLINKWKEHECLYNRSHENYTSKQARYQALSVIAEEMSEDFPSITIEDVKSKVNYLRGQYTRVLAKKRENIKVVGKDSSFWFAKLGFLNAYIQPRKREGYKQSATDDSLNFSRDPCDPLESEGSPIKIFKIQEGAPSNYEYDFSLKAKTEIEPHCESIAERSYSSNDSPLNAATNAFITYSPPKSETICQSDNFATFLKVEFTKITNQAIYDEMMENIMQCVFDAKKKQRQANNNCDLQFN